MDRLRKTTTAEVARLEAAHKKSELKIQGLERSLEQKVVLSYLLYCAQPCSTVGRLPDIHGEA